MYHFWSIGFWSIRFWSNGFQSIRFRSIGFRCNGMYPIVTYTYFVNKVKWNIIYFILFFFIVFFYFFPLVTISKYSFIFINCVPGWVLLRVSIPERIILKRTGWKMKCVCLSVFSLLATIPLIAVSYHRLYETKWLSLSITDKTGDVKMFVFKGYDLGAEIVVFNFTVIFIGITSQTNISFTWLMIYIRKHDQKIYQRSVLLK